MYWASYLLGGDGWAAAHQSPVPLVHEIDIADFKGVGVGFTPNYYTTVIPIEKSAIPAFPTPPDFPFPLFRLSRFCPPTPLHY